MRVFCAGRLAIGAMEHIIVLLYPAKSVTAKIRIGSVFPFT